MQIEHSALPSDPIISVVIFFLGSERIAVSGAGAGAVPCWALSIICDMTRSSSSWEYTASPLRLKSNMAESIAKGLKPKGLAPAGGMCAPWPVVPPWVSRVPSRASRKLPCRRHLELATYKKCQCGGKSNHLPSEALKLLQDVRVTGKLLGTPGTSVSRLEPTMHDIRLSHARCMRIRRHVHSWGSMRLIISIVHPHTLKEIIKGRHKRWERLSWLGSSARRVPATDCGATKGEATIRRSV